jgi:hypothetical protein
VPRLVLEGYSYWKKIIEIMWELASCVVDTPHGLVPITALGPELLAGGLMRMRERKVWIVRAEVHITNVLCLQALYRGLRRAKWGRGVVARAFNGNRQAFIAVYLFDKRELTRGDLRKAGIRSSDKSVQDLKKYIRSRMPNFKP